MDDTTALSLKEELEDAYFFAAGSVECIFQTYQPGWKVSGIVPSYFEDKKYLTSNICEAFRSALDKSVANAASLAFDECCGRRNFNYELLEVQLKMITSSLAQNVAGKLDFLRACAFIGEFAAIGYVHGLFNAPGCAILCITHLIQKHFDGNEHGPIVWRKLDRFAKLFIRKSNYCMSQINLRDTEKTAEYVTSQTLQSFIDNSVERFTRNIPSNRELEINHDKYHSLSGGLSREFSGINAKANASNNTSTTLYPRTCNMQGGQSFASNGPSSHTGEYRHMSHPSILQGSSSHSSMDAQWQQKMTNPWVMAHYEDMRLERERLRGRERDKGRIERQSEEKCEKDWQEQERIDREERERVQREAVQQHFEESLRLALQKQKTLGHHLIGKNHSKATENSIAIPGQTVETDKFREQDKERERALYMDNNHARMEQERWLTSLHPHRNDQPQKSHHQSHYQPMESRSLRNPSGVEMPMNVQVSSPKSGLVSNSVSSPISQMKQETKFNLYGYQPYKPTYISHAELKAREEVNMNTSVPSVRVHRSNMSAKGEKDNFLSDRLSSPNSDHCVNQALNKHKTTVSQEKGGSMYQPFVGRGGAFKPYEFANSSGILVPAHENQNSTHDILHQIQEQPQNLVKSDSKTQEIENSSNDYNIVESKSINSMSNTNRSFSPPHVSSKSVPNTNNSAYSYSLIQQGLIPNPIYMSSLQVGKSKSSSTPPFSQSHNSKSLHPDNTLMLSSQSGRPNSAPFSIHPAIGHSYSYGHHIRESIGGNSSSPKMYSALDALHLSQHSGEPIPNLKCPSPTRLYDMSSESKPFVNNQNSPSLPVSHTNSFISPIEIQGNSPYSTIPQSANVQNVVLPLVKRRLISDTTSRKRPKSHDDTLFASQLPMPFPKMPEGHSACSTNIADNTQYSDRLNVELVIKSRSPSPISMNVLFKTENTMPLDIPNSIPVLVTDSIMNNRLGSDVVKNSIKHTEGLIITRDIPHTFENDSSYSENNSEKPELDQTASTISIKQEANRDGDNEIDSNFIDDIYLSNNCLSLSSSNNACHPKLKKAWLQRHSENKNEPYIKSEASTEEFLYQEKSEILNTKLGPMVLIESNKNESCINELKEKDITGKIIKVEEFSSDSNQSDVHLTTKCKSLRDFSGSIKHIKSEVEVEAAYSPRKDRDHKKKRHDKDSRKRGRKSKVPTLSLANSSKQKENVKNVAYIKLPEKPSLAVLKKTGQAFLQDNSCSEVAPRLPKCRDCRLASHQRKLKSSNNFCRFTAYRKLRYGKNGTILSAGFSEPTDASEDDLKLWLPPSNVPPLDNEIETSKFVLTYIGDQLCDLVEMEKGAQMMHMSNDSTITWKKVMQGTREMCDVCETTLFNIHWVCHKCGFVVCLDCYKARKNGITKDELTTKERDEYAWLFCSNKQAHEQDKLLLTQIVAGSALWDMGKILHTVRRKWNIPTYCNCELNEYDQDSKNSSNGIGKLMSAVTKCFSSDKESSREATDTQRTFDTQKSLKRSIKNTNTSTIKSEEKAGCFSSESGGSPLSWLADVALSSSSKASDDQKDDDEKIEYHDKSDGSLDSDDEKNGNFSTLRELLIRPTSKMAGKNVIGNSSSQKTLTSTLDEVISCVIEQKVRKSNKKCKEKQLLHFTRRVKMQKSRRELPPVRTCILTESSLLYPDIPHMWLGDGKILLLKDAYNVGNMQMFQEQWKRGQPVIVADVGKHLNSALWTPDSFLREFGDKKTDFLSYTGSVLITNQPLKKFWEGFENLSKRMKSETGETLLLKLLDWPPADEFHVMMPTRFEDFMKVLPLPQYTHLDGNLNMVSRLPEIFLQPNLGPKLYNAYGVSSSLGKGSANLHLDVSDALNVLAYVGVPHDGDERIHKDILDAFGKAGCDALTMQRIKGKELKPGALWHIYNARDADKIRDFLNKVSEEQGVKLNPHHDPIHNQEWYLDERFRRRLSKEYGVEAYTIAQCCGDAILVPAGAPHQVLNLYSCVQVSMDFVSPESVGNSFSLTQEIRNLSNNSISNEDRLQIKNIIYHAVKDALALLQSHEPKESET